MKHYPFSSEFMNLLAPIVGGADCDAETARYLNLDSNSEIEVRKVIQERLLPDFLNLSSLAQKALIQEAENHLTSSEADFERLFYSVLPPFDAPKDPREFFVWLLDEMRLAIK